MKGWLLLFWLGLGSWIGCGKADYDSQLETRIQQLRTTATVPDEGENAPADAESKTPPTEDEDTAAEDASSDEAEETGDEETGDEELQNADDEEAAE